jgi:cytochrome c-type biogenesis protein CcmH/NrfG
MGWLLILALALLVFAGLWRWARVEPAALQLVGAALLIALAGYAWQGRPGLVGQPKQAPERGSLPESGFARLRGDMLGQVDSASRWLTIAEGYQRRGDTESAAEIVRSGLRYDPRNPDLWIGLGYALVLHGDGVMTPAAEMAFRRAAEAAPGHPGARFFYGLALAQGGNVEGAERVWRALLANLPAGGGQWRSAVEQRLRLIDELRAGAGARVPPEPARQPTP